MANLLVNVTCNYCTKEMTQTDQGVAIRGVVLPLGQPDQPDPGGTGLGNMTAALLAGLVSPVFACRECLLNRTVDAGKPRSPAQQLLPAGRVDSNAL